MATIAAGKGRGPKPFMLAAKNAAEPDAVWDSNKGLAAEARRQGRSTSKPARRAPSAPKAFGAAARFHRAPAVPIGFAAADRDRLVARNQIRRLSRSAAGPERQGEPEDPEGPRLDSQIPRDCRRGRLAARCDHRRRDRRARRKRRARLCRPAGGAIRTEHRAIWSSTPSISCSTAQTTYARWRSPSGRDDWRRCSRPGKPAKARASASSSISRRAATRCCVRPASSRSRASSRSGRTRPIAPAGRTAGRRPNAAPAMKWSSAAGARPTAISVRCWSACIGASISSISAGSAPATARPRSSNCCRG